MGSAESFQEVIPKIGGRGMPGFDKLTTPQ
jgi:hypothetical protein